MKAHMKIICCICSFVGFLACHDASASVKSLNKYIPIKTVQLTDANHVALCKKKCHHYGRCYGGTYLSAKSAPPNGSCRCLDKTSFFKSGGKEGNC